MLRPLLFSLVTALSLTAAPSVPKQLKTQITAAAKRAYLDPVLLEAVVRAESNFDASAVSHKGAMGLMQVMPKTAKVCGVAHPFHATNNLMGAARCLRLLMNRYQGNLKLALAAYNAGVGAVTRYKGIPPFRETQNYVRKILAFIDEEKEKRKTKVGEGRVEK